MAFLNMLARLRHTINSRIKAGEFTQKELGYRADLSQAAISNFVNAKRGTTFETADHLTRLLEINLEALLEPASIPPRPPGELVPVILQHNALAPYISPDAVLRQSNEYVRAFDSLPTMVTAERESWVRFVALSVTRKQGKFMHPRLHEKDLIIIDRHCHQLGPAQAARPDWIYAVADGDFLAIGYPEPNQGELLLFGESRGVLHILIPRARSASHLIVGRVCLIKSPILR